MIKHRFDNDFYRKIVLYHNKTGLTIKSVCKRVNKKVNELSGLLSPNGALHILLDELKNE